MGILDTMKKVAQGTQNAGTPAAFMFGVVTAESPLKIRVDNRFDISGDAIVVMKQFKAEYYPTHYHTGVKGPAETEARSGGSGEPAFESHTHELKNNYQTNDDATSEKYYGLKTGEKVVLFRNQGGQSFLVLGRV